MSRKRGAFPESESVESKIVSCVKKTLFIITAILLLLYAAWESTASSTKTFLLSMLDFALHGKGGDYHILADLGGAPVSLPRSVVSWVEYDDKEEYVRQRKALPDERTRTTKDKIASFGFRTHFPDMELETPEVAKRENGKDTMYTTTWLHVGIDSHSALSGGILGLERIYQYTPHALDYRGADFTYQKQPELVHGLIAYYPMQRVISPQGETTWKAVDDQSHYFHLADNGKVDAYIRCSYIKHAASPCSHSFYLTPTMMAQISVSYRNGLLPHWQEIQNSVGQVILGWAIDSSASKISK